MKYPWLFGSAATIVVSAAGITQGGTTTFVSTLNGANERPDPVRTNATGSASAVLTGEEGSYVLNFKLTYSGLSSDPIGGHIHYSIVPPGSQPTEQIGPIVEEMDDFPDGNGRPFGRAGVIEGDWRFDDRTKPLTDALVDSLFDGELYFNIHTMNHPAGEIRGQIVRGAVHAIPLPPAVMTGLIGMGASGLMALRLRRRMR